MAENPNPAFMIGALPVHGRVILAPMDGISDHPTRLLCRRLGSALVYTEFINVLDVPAGLNNLERRILFTEEERPIGFQLYGSQPEQFAQAAQVLLPYRPDFFDINLGCSVQRVVGRGAGAGLLAEPQAIAEIMLRMKQTCDLPITAKMRIGWDADHRNYLEIAHLLQEAGADALAVHGRTRRQKWSDPSDWAAIREVKAHVSIPAIGNGDVRTLADIDRMQAETGCDAVMIGRAALGNPWLFARVNKAGLERSAILEVIREHWEGMAAYYGAEKAAYNFRKHLKAYLDCPQFADLDAKPILTSPQPAAALYAALGMSY